MPLHRLFAPRLLPVVLLLLLAGTLSPALRATRARAEPPPVSYGWPVVGPVIRPFEGPESPYAAGHRGIDIGAAFGSTVAASADGVVAFAGSVAGSRFVSIDHADGIRNTNSWLSAIRVRAGVRVSRGDPIAASGHGHPEVDRPHLHFGARRGEVYLDPRVLLGVGPATVHLAPLDHEGGVSSHRASRGAADGLPPARAGTAMDWLWSRAEPKPLVLPGRAGDGVGP